MKKSDEEELQVLEGKSSTTPTKRKLERLHKVKQEAESPRKKRTKKLESGPRNRRKTLQMVESNEYDKSKHEYLNDLLNKLLEKQGKPLERSLGRQR